MSLGSRLLARWAGLPPARTYAVAVERGLRVPMADGVELLADRYHPRGGGGEPIVLLRSPYGRGQLWAWIARVFAERGYQAVVQSVRGTFGSGGEFRALRHEEADGRATLEWLAARPWFGGGVAMVGPSYLGFVQWAVAADAPESFKALVPVTTASQFRGLTYPGESFDLDTAISWIYLLHHQEQSARRAFWSTLGQRRTLARAFATLPLCKADEAAVGERVKSYQAWLEHNQPGDPFWDEIDFSRRLDRVTAPAHLVAGWYDIFLPDQLADYQALRRAGRAPHLTVGPWKHVSLGTVRAALREALAWTDAHMRGDATRLRPSPVRLYVMGAGRWLDLEDWPPPATTVRWHLHAGGGLAPEPPAASDPDRYRYDPADPTPAVGGIVLGAHAGPRDNRGLEARADVLVYTSAPLEGDLEVIGPVAAELYVRSSLEHTDFFARLCDVEPGGRSINVCDGLIRLWPGRAERAADGALRVRVELWPTAYRFRAGHRVRVQVSSGAHPRASRNPGSGEPLGTATTLRAADQQILHDPEHPSAVLLPVYAGAGE